MRRLALLSLLAASACLLVVACRSESPLHLRRHLGMASNGASDNVRFSGNTTFTEEQLRAAISEQLREIREKGLTPPRADDTAFYVGSYYRKAGFSQVEVSFDIRGNVLAVRIREGPRTLLGKLHFVGNRSIPETTLYDYMVGATQERMSREPAQFPFTEAEISAGADRVRGLFVSEGFLDATVDAADKRLSNNGTRADVTIKITEGKRYLYGEIRFEGNVLFGRDELLKALGEPTTGAFSATKANSMQRHLQSFYKSRGYYQAEVAVVADPKKAGGTRVPVTFTVTPKQLFRFGGVTVRNETERPRLRESFLPRRFAHLRGEVYNPEQLDETFREMQRTGLFKNFRVTPQPEPDGRLRLDLTIEEAKAKELGFNVGFNTYEGAVAGFSIGDRNLFGNGRPLTFNVQMSQRGLLGELLYVDPWFLDSRYAFRARLYSVAREEKGYAKSEQGLRLELSRKFLPHLELSAFAQAGTARITDSVIEPIYLGPTDYAFASIGIAQNTDFRDNPINPGRGFVAGSSFEFGTVANQPAFTRSTLRLSYYLPVGKTLFAFGARGGLISPISDSIPIDVRFFNGGSTTVRSFAERELGPKDKTGNPIGGEFFTVFNVEYIFPLVGALQGAVFVDAGNVRNDLAAGSGDLRYGIGAGLRYKLPIGPLRLDYGVNPSPKKDEDFGAFHFSFGFAF